jgi:hypothetical protein
MTDTDAPGDQRRLSEFAADDPPLSDFSRGTRCQAISVRYSRQCQRGALAGIPYCPDHADLVDADSTRDD